MICSSPKMKRAARVLSAPDGGSNQATLSRSIAMAESQPTLAQAAPQTTEVEYRDIPGFPGYRIGSDGTIWTSRSRGSKGSNLKTKPWTQIFPRINGDGYVVASLSKDNRRRTVRIARLMLEAFVGPCPVGMQARHYPDPNRLNNSLDNLRWGTPKQNAGDRIEHGNQARGTRCARSRLTETDVAEIRRLCAAGVNRREIANCFHTTIENVWSIYSRKTWSHV